MHLVLSNNNKLWKKKKKNVLVGSWCLSGKNRFIEEKNNNFIFPKYHWQNEKKLNKDLKYLFRLYKIFLKKISKVLNKFHKTNYPQRYWEILLSRWLWRFIIFHYDRWEIISDIQKKFHKLECNIFKFKGENFIPDNSYYYTSSMIYSDDWNHWVLSEILKFQDKIKINNVNKNEKLPQFLFKKEKKLLKTNSVFNSVLSKFCSKKIIAQNLYFSKIAKLFFNFYYKQFRIVDSLTENNFNNKPNLEERKKYLHILSKRKNFEKFLFQQLKYNLPKIFFENYKENINKIADLFLPKNPKVIMTSIDHHFNDLFKLYAAKNVLLGAKYFIFQHGGLYGTSNHLMAEKMDIRLSDKFFSWGWGGNKKVIPFFLQKKMFHNNVSNNFDENKGLVIPITEFYLCPGDVGSGRPRYKYEIDKYIDTIHFFLKHVELRIKNKSSIKFIENKDIRYVLNSLKHKHPKINFFKSRKDTNQLHKKFKITIETVNSTGFLESMHLNIPTILLINKNYFSIRNSAKSSFNELEKMKILHYCPVEAAKFVNTNYDNLNEWWCGNNLQKARKLFCNLYARRSLSPFLDIKKLIKYI